MRVVGVLALVDDHVGEPLAVLLGDLVVLGEQAVRGEREVVEVERVGSPELGVVGVPDACGRLREVGVRLL